MKKVWERPVISFFVHRRWEVRLSKIRNGTVLFILKADLYSTIFPKFLALVVDAFRSIEEAPIEFDFHGFAGTRPWISLPTVWHSLASDVIFSHLANGGQWLLRGERRAHAFNVLQEVLWRALLRPSINRQIAQPDIDASSMTWSTSPLYGVR